MAEWHWQLVADDMLDGLPHAALTAVRQVVNARLSDRRPRRTRRHHPGELDQLTRVTTEAPGAIRQVPEQPETVARMIAGILTGDAGRAGVYYNGKERPVNGSALVREQEFTERVVSETRALLARISA